jgi:NADH dehydrogenase
MHGFADALGGTPATVDRDGTGVAVTAAEQAGADVVLVSIIGADRAHPIDLFRVKAAAEDVVRESTAPWTVVRGSAYAQLWADIMVMTAGRSGRPMVTGRGRTLHNFVDVDDVVAVLVRAVEDPALRGRVLSVGGPENLTRDEVARRVQAVKGWTGGPRHLPAAVASAMGALLGPFRPVLAQQMRLGAALDRVSTAWDAATVHEGDPWIPCTPVSFAPTGSAGVRG